MFMRRVGEELMKGDDVPRDLIVTIQIHKYSFLHNGPVKWNAICSMLVPLIALRSEVSGSPETWGRWGRFPAFGPHRQRLLHTASEACQSPGSVYSWPEPANCTDGFAQTPDKCSASAARCRRDPLKHDSSVFRH